MKKLLLTCISLAVSILTFAAKADPQPQFFTQADGSILTVYTHGDEYGIFFTADDGTLLINDNEQFYIAQIKEDGSLVSTGVIAHNKDMRTLWEQDLAKSQKQELFLSSFNKRATNVKKTFNIPTGYFPRVGNPHVLTVLVDFQDSTFKWSNEKEIFDNFLNGEQLDPDLADGTLANNYCSIAEYFNEMSNGLYRPVFDVVGPIRLPSPLKTYGAGDNDNVAQIVKDAIPLIEDSVDFTKYDLNGDGYIDLVHFICASYSQSQNSTITNLIWPKVTAVGVKTNQGVKTSRVSFTCELHRKPTSYPTPHVAGIGLMAHEFSHTIGMPDLYSTTSTACMINQTLEYWDLMDGGEYVNNGTNPAAYSAWEREVCGWFTIDTLYEDAIINLKPLSEGGKAYRIFPDSLSGGNHYFIVENIQKTGCNQYMLGHGMLVSDITDNGFSVFPNDAYTTKTIDDQYCYFSKSKNTIVPADGFIPMSYQIGETIYDGETATTFDVNDYRTSQLADPYPGTGNVTSVLRECKDVYKNVTQGRYYYTTKDGYTGKPIKNIKETIFEGDYFATITFCYGDVPEILRGDANGDWNVDVSDITTIAAYILGDTPEKWNETNADANADNLIDVTDITTTASIILSK